MAKLTTTTYAILGLLERRPWSAYELTKYMQLSAIRAVWPRTESRIYLEFKNLLSHELATAEQDGKSKRKRTVYTITANGKKVLREWLQTPEGTLRLESEPLLKMLFADIDKATVKTQLDHIRTKLIDEIKTTQLGLNEALNQGFYFEDNAALNAQLLRLLNELLEARTRWLVESIEASQRLAAQPDDADAAREIYRAESERLGKLLATLEGL